MMKKYIIVLVLLNVCCNCQLSDYVVPRETQTTRDLTGLLANNPVVDLATFVYGNVLASAVGVITHVPLVLAQALESIEIPQLNMDINNVEYVDRLVADFDASSGNEDATMDIEALVTKYGHQIEKHRVVTDDGYILAVYRIPNNGSSVFLMHGLLGSADDFVISGPVSGLAYLLADEGYDVWLGNARGNKFSRRHTYYKPSDAVFWDFSFHEIGVYDLPAMIDYVLEEINQESIKYIGHSQGTTSFFVMTSERPDYNKKISLMVALSPVAFMSHVESPIVRLLAPGTQVLSAVFKSAGVYEFLPDNNIIRILKLAICGHGALAEILCSNTMFLVAGFDLGQLNITNLPVVFGHLPSGASTKQFIHYGQGVVSGDFRKFDYGATENLRRYNAITPPNYDLSKIVTPISLFYSDSDWLAHPVDVEKLYSNLNSVFDVNRVPYEQFNHLDFILAKDLKTLIYEKLRKVLQTF